MILGAKPLINTNWVNSWVPSDVQTFFFKVRKTKTHKEITLAIKLLLKAKLLDAVYMSPSEYYFLHTHTQTFFLSDNLKVYKSSKATFRPLLHIYM